MTLNRLQIWSALALFTCVAADNFVFRFSDDKTGVKNHVREDGSSRDLLDQRQVDKARQLLSENPAMHTLNDRIIFSVFSGQNEVVCTLCVMQILAGVFHLGDHRVQQEIRRAFNSPHLDEAIQAAVQVLAKDSTLKSFFRSYYSAGAFPQCRPRLSQQLQNKCQKHRHFISEQGQMVDFRLPSTISTINSDVEEATDGQIRGLFTRLPSDAVLVMASALTFSSKWLSHMSSRSGSFQVATAAGRRQQPTNMLWHEEVLPLLDGGDDHVQGVALPYGETRSIRLFLFRKTSCDDDIRSSLYQRHLMELNRAPAKSNVLVQLPEFDIVSKKSDYVDLLRQMNVTTMFQEGLGVHGNLKVRIMTHKAKIEVNQDGTRAAGAAGAAIVPLSAKPEPFRIVFDCPFVAVLYHSELDMPLFTAYLTNPTIK